MEGTGGQGRAGQGRVPDCLGGLSRVGISSRSTRPWNGQPPSFFYYAAGLVRLLVPLYPGVSVSARYCIPQCVRLIAGGGG